MSVVCGLAVAIAMAVAGCAEPPGIRVEEVCDSLCRCQAPIEADRAACTTQCNTQLANLAVPDGCLACLDEPLCTTLETCFEACLPPQVTP
jgi:hypothetical protein